MTVALRYECGVCGAIITSVNGIVSKCVCGNADNTKMTLLGAYEKDKVPEIIVVPTCEQMIEARAAFAQAYQDIVKEIGYWMDVKEDEKKVIAMWIVGTYLHNNFNTYPYLFLNAMRGSGKTRLLRIISYLSAKGDGTIQNDMKEAVLFRLERNKVLCIDEFENVGAKEKQTLRQILNSAYKKGLKISRMKKSYKDKEEKFVQEDFEPYMPVAMANIWGMDEVLGDRAISLIIEKSDNPGKTKLVENFDECISFKNIKSSLNNHLVSFSVVSLLKNIYIDWNNYIKQKYESTIYINTNNTNNTKQHNSTDLEMIFNKIDEKNISGRNFELMFPLLITAYAIHEDYFLELLEILGNTMKDKQKDEFAESKDVSLYEFVSTLDAYRFQWITLKGLVSMFRQYMGEQDQEDQWLNEKWLGRACKRLMLVGQTKRKNTGREVMLNIDKAKEKIKIFKKFDVDKDEDKSI
jgi:hypothetical protein